MNTPLMAELLSTDDSPQAHPSDSTPISLDDNSPWNAGGPL